MKEDLYLVSALHSNRYKNKKNQRTQHNLMNTFLFARPISVRLLFLLCVIPVLLIACDASTAEQPSDTSEISTEANADEIGTLSLTANGEDFVRQGFVSKDGWQITFDHLYLTVADVIAYQSDPPFDAASGSTPEGPSVASPGPITVDLAEGDENAEPIIIEEVTAAAGQYNALGWRMVPAADGDAAGATILLQGQAEKDGEVVSFIIRDETEYAYNCGEFVGESRKGILEAGSMADVEATFHFDHLFGDADTPADDALNVDALGFEPLAALAQEGTLETSVAELETQLDAKAHEMLTNALAGLGHVGEGHCFEATGGYTGHSE